MAKKQRTVNLMVATPGTQTKKIRVSANITVSELKKRMNAEDYTAFINGKIASDDAKIEKSSIVVFAPLTKGA